MKYKVIYGINPLEPGNYDVISTDKATAIHLANIRNRPCVDPDFYICIYDMNANRIAQVRDVNGTIIDLVDEKEVRTCL